MRFTLSRAAALALAAAILPSCGHGYEKWVWVTVTNQGTVSADVRAETEGWWDSTLEDEDYTVAAGESIQFRFRSGDLTRLKIHIYRSTDHFKLFDDFWNREDLDHLDWRVTIVVSP